MKQLLYFRLRNRSAIRALTLVAMVAALASCATPEVGVGSAKTRQAATLLAESRHAKDPATQVGLALAAADEASGDLSDGNARETYNAASAAIAALAGGTDGEVSVPATFSTPWGNYRLEFAATQPSGTWAPGYFAKLIPTAEIKNKAFVSKQPLAGYGGALVGIYRPAEPRKLLLPRIGVSAPVTAVVNFSKPTSPGAPTLAILTLYNSAKRDKASVAGAKRPLAADLGAPFGYYPQPGLMGLVAAINAEKYLEKEGFFLIQPYDPDKIPIVFIHGLISDPQIWLPMMASIESDPVLRAKFQFWAFAYPTGNPIAYSALELRKALAAVYEVYPKTKDMMIVNHSLGGDLTHLQVINPGALLVEEIFKKNAPKIMAMPADSLVKEGLLIKANPRIERVAFIAAPHRGAPMAIGIIGKIGAALIHLPGQVISGIGNATFAMADDAAGVKPSIISNSVSALSPRSPLLTAMNKVPMQTKFHSIIGVYGRPKEPLEKTSDTVVPYWSSHQDAALSEKLVPAPHTSIYLHPETIAEVKRILHLHLKSLGEAQ